MVRYDKDKLQIEEQLVQQSAPIATQRHCEFQQATTMLRQKWSILKRTSPLIPAMSFHTQFRTLTGRFTASDPGKVHEVVLLELNWLNVNCYC